MIQWGIGLRVPGSSDWETRYAEVMSGQSVPTDFAWDVTQLKAQADAMIAQSNWEAKKPYAVYMTSLRDYQAEGSQQLTVEIEPA